MALRYAAALLATGIAIGATHLLQPWLQGTILPPTLAAVVVSAILGGLGPGLLSGVVGTLALKYLFLPEVHTLFSLSTESAVRLGMFVALAFPLALLAASQRAASRRLERAVHVRNDLLAIVSHDLRGPLTAVGLNTELLARGVASGRIPASVYPRVQRIDQAAAHMERLIEDLLDYASVEAGTLAVEPRPTDARDLAEEALGMAEPLARERNIALVRPPPVVATVLCDRGRVVQVLGNLIGNALKFTPAGGRVELIVAETADGVRFGVRDTGPGIAPADLPRLFDRYWKGRKGDARGAGLGLAIAKAIVQAHGRTISVDSRPGAGSLFSFTLPRAAAQERALSVEPSTIRAAGYGAGT